MIAAAEKLPLEELRRRFEERLEEQKKRHDGGNRWIGTGGTSPFGHGGANPAGVRVGGSGGGRSAIQIASARQYKNYRHDRVLDVRQLAVALKKLRQLTRRHSDLELDIDESIDKTCRNAGELTLTFTPPRKERSARTACSWTPGAPWIRTRIWLNACSPPPTGYNTGRSSRRSLFTIACIPSSSRGGPRSTNRS